QQHRLVPVRPGDEHGLVAEKLHPHRLLRLLWKRRGTVCAGARVARTGLPDRPVRDDAVVAVAPFDAERVAPDLLQALDVRPFAHAVGYRAEARGSRGRASGARLGRMIDSSAVVAVTLRPCPSPSLPTPTDT